MTTRRQDLTDSVFDLIVLPVTLVLSLVALFGRKKNPKVV